jgi:hypothetical protein
VSIAGMAGTSVQGDERTPLVMPGDHRSDGGEMGPEQPKAGFVEKLFAPGGTFIAHVDTARPRGRVHEGE